MDTHWVTMGIGMGVETDNEREGTAVAKGRHANPDGNWFGFWVE